MNILFLSLLYHPDAVDQTLALSKTGLQNQANTFQWAMIDGIRENLRPGETLSVLNALPVGIYPKQYKKICLQTHTFDKQFMEIGSWNLPVCKQKQREHATRKYIERWMEQSEQNRMIVLYSLYLPYLRAIAAVKHKYPALKSCVIVTDLPGNLGLASGRQGVLKAMEYRMGEQSLQLASQIDGFILLTEQMAEPLQAEHKKRCVIEGLVGGESVQWQTVAFPQDARPAVLYTGTLNRELGIGQLLEAFQHLPEYQLWLCGKGDMEPLIAQMQKQQDNIRYFGFVSHAQARYLQSKAALLINPRTNQGLYTQYSFPSKTMEYMRSGKPVLCCKLAGIPTEYDDYLIYIEPQNAEGIRQTIQNMMTLSQKERDDIGHRAKTFVLSEKSATMQGFKAVSLLRKL